ncbi:MAG: N-6 DNA methylase [Lachnospiraceae bacterium]|nr:N-6 DNA methylase [Lachnospiraceae bacterium]
MEKKDYKKEFCALMDRFAFRYSKWQIWNDFLSLSAISLANVMPVPEKEEREKLYFSIIGSYQKEDQEVFPKMLELVVLALEENPEQDFLGSLYHHLGLHQEQKGQFFTPYHICHFMSELQFAGDEKEEQLKEKGYISVNDPACGAGAMLIAFANVAKKHGINYQKQVLFVAQDIDRTAAMMCYIQLSLLGCPAIVIIGDSLAKPFLHPDNEAWYTPFFYLNQRRFMPGQAGGERADGMDAGCGQDMIETAASLPGSMKLLEGADGQLMLCMEQAS